MTMLSLLQAVFSSPGSRISSVLDRVERRMRVRAFFVLTFAWSWSWSWSWTCGLLSAAVKAQCAGTVVAALILHTAINTWPSIIPGLPTGDSHRPDALPVAMLVLVALGLSAQSSVAARSSLSRSVHSL